MSITAEIQLFITTWGPLSHSSLRMVQKWYRYLENTTISHSVIMTDVSILSNLFLCNLNFKNYEVNKIIFFCSHTSLYCRRSSGTDAADYHHYRTEHGR